MIATTFLVTNGFFWKQEFWNPEHIRCFLWGASVTNTRDCKTGFEELAPKGYVLTNIGNWWEIEYTG